MLSRHAALSLLLMAFTAVQLLGQVGTPQTDVHDRPGMDDHRAPWGETSIVGLVRLADGHSAREVRIELHDLNTGATLRSGVTDIQGNFEFRNVAPGNYEVVAFSGIAEARERVDLNSGDATIALRLPTESTDSGSTGTVSVAQMKVPEKAKKELHKARLLLDKYKTVEAREAASKALEIYPNYAEAHALLGLIDLQERNNSDAVAELEKAVQLDPNSASCFAALGATYNALHRFKDALRAVNTSIRLAPNYWQAYFEAGKAYLGEGEFIASLQNTDKALGFMTKEFSPIRLVRAQALLGLKQYPKAAAELEQYLSHNPQGPEATQARQTLDQVKAFVAGGGQ